MLHKKYSGHRNPSCTKQRRNLRVESSDEQHGLLILNGSVKFTTKFCLENSWLEEFYKTLMKMITSDLL
jgi:hypothetical protein